MIRCGSAPSPLSKGRWGRVWEFVHGPKFSTAVVIVKKVQSGVSGVVERRTRRVWHLVNLPAGSDVRKNRNQIGDLDHECGSFAGRSRRGAEAVPGGAARAAGRGGLGSGEGPATAKRR